MKELEDTLHEVYTTAAGIVYQSDKENSLYLDFGGKYAVYTFSSFRRLKNAVDKIDIELMLTNSSHADLEIIFLKGCQHIYILSSFEVIELKELIHGAFVMFQLNHILKDCLHRLAI